MNLKESFRYQNFLDMLMRSASVSITSKDHCLVTTKTHHYNKANPEAEDVEETISVDEFFPNDTVIAFMKWLVEEREKLTKAIGAAKASVGFDIDAAVATNKFRQEINSSIKNMLRYTPTKRVEQGRGYKFNAEGNQMPYLYEIEVSTTEAYDKEGAKQYMRSVITDADKVSADILKNNALALTHDIDLQKVSGISIWIRFDADSIPTLEIEKDYFLH